MYNLDAQDAEGIATKLNAEIVKKRKAHHLAIIRYKGTLIAQFGIRRSSKKGTSHNYIPDKIYWSPHKCKECAKCNLGFDDYVHDLIADGIIRISAPRQTRSA